MVVREKLSLPSRGREDASASRKASVCGEPIPEMISVGAAALLNYFPEETFYDRTTYPEAVSEEVLRALLSVSSTVSALTSARTRRRS